jgi:hypothetical protein
MLAVLANDSLDAKLLAVEVGLAHTGRTTRPPVVVAQHPVQLL